MADTELDDYSLLIAPGPVQTALVVDDDALRRLGTVVRHLCVGMIDEAIQLTVISRSVPCAVGEMIGPSRVVTAPRRLLQVGNRLLIDRLNEKLGTWRPQVVHCLSSELAHWACDWARVSNSVLVVHLMDLKDVHAFAGLERFPHLLAITNTPVVERALLKAYPKIAPVVSTVPLGVPTVDQMACYSHPDQVPAVIMTAPLEYGSGVELALKALHAVHETGQDLHMFVLSDGHAEASFRRQLDRFGLRSLVTFAGTMPDSESLRNAMVASDLFLRPMAPDRFTAHALLAMATGLAVLAPAGTIDDYLIDGQTASLFQPRVTDLAEKWLSLLRDHEQARKLARGAQEYARAYHKASFMVCAIAVLYRQAVGRIKSADRPALPEGQTIME
jgi:glycosyltransferase involved in cell wall biosynthesis